jgi:hypothetical protein
VDEAEPNILTTDICRVLEGKTIDQELYEWKVTVFGLGVEKILYVA